MSARETMLADRVEELAEENRQLRDLLAPPLILPEAWKLTGSEATLFCHLAARQLVSTESAYVALYGGDPERDPKIVDVFICKMRKKLAPFGVSIRTLWGQGYQLEDRRRWRALLEHQEDTDMQTMRISFSVNKAVFDGLERRAAPLNLRPSEYARRLFEAGYYARVQAERDKPLERQVRQVFLMADCEPDYIADVLSIPAERVNRIIDGWRTIGCELAAQPAGQPKAKVTLHVDASGPADKTVRSMAGEGARGGFSAVQRSTISAMWKDGRAASEIGAAVDSDADGIRAFAQANRDLCPARPQGNQRTKPVAPVAGVIRSWSDADIRTLKTMWAENASPAEIAAALGRTEKAISVYAGKHRGICPVRKVA